MAIAMLIITPALASKFEAQISNTANVEVGSGFIDPDLSNNTSTAILNKQSRVSVRKIAIGDNSEFEFKSSFSDLNIQIATANAVGESGYKAVDIGLHTLFEEPKPGWSLRSVSCQDPDGGTIVDPETMSIKLDVDPFEDIDCEFINQKNGVFTLKKISIDGNGEFEFSTSLMASDETSANTLIQTAAGIGERSFADVLPGDHIIDEQPQVGWDLVDVKCDVKNKEKLVLPEDLDSDGVLDFTAVKFELDVAESGSCTFTNRKALPSLNVTQFVSDEPAYVGNDTFKATLQVSVLNSGNTAIYLDSILNSLEDSFAGQGQITQVGSPSFIDVPAGFTGTLNSQFDGQTGLKGNSLNLLDSTGRLNVGEHVTLAFSVGFKPTHLTGFSVNNSITAAGLGSNLPVSDISEDSASVGAIGSTPTPIKIGSSGVIYDSITLTPIYGATVVLVDDNKSALPDACFATGQQGQTTTTSGQYRIDVNVGVNPKCPVSGGAFSIQITPPFDYSGQSVIRPTSDHMFDLVSCGQAGVSGSCEIGEQYSAASLEAGYEYYLKFAYGVDTPEIKYNNIPLDPKTILGEMSLIKTAEVSSAAIGDVVPFVLTITNAGDYATSNFRVVDQLPSSLAYVANSAKLVINEDDGVNKSLSIEPDQSGGTLVWQINAEMNPPFNAINPEKALSLSYLTRVTTNQSNGEIRNRAQVQDLSGAALSNIAEASVSLKAEPVFQCATVLGRVFDDINGNGRLDHPDEPRFNLETTKVEFGVPNVKLFTVNGQWIKTDDHGRYHVSCAALPDDRIGENFALKLDINSLPDGYGPTDENPKIVRLSAGLISVLNFPVQTYVESDQNVVRRNVSGLTDLTATEFEKKWYLPLEVTTQQLEEAKASGERIPFGRPIYLAMLDLRAQQAILRHLEAGIKKDVVIDGRLAGYFKGRVKGNVLITMMADTGYGDIRGLFSDFTAQRKDAYAKLIDPARYYPVFGDQSSITEGAPTTGKFYVRIEKGENYAVWGSVQADLKGSAFVQANSKIYGGRLHLQTTNESAEKLSSFETPTKFGEPRAVIDAYAAKPDVHKSFVKFRANGGSNFFLRHSDVLPGTESIQVQVINPVTGLVRSTKDLTLDTDYTMDYARGRLALVRALPSSLFDEDIFDLGGEQNDQVFILANYSHSDPKSNDTGLVAGARATVWANNYLGLGLGAKRAASGDRNFKIGEVDATIRKTKDTYVKAEIAASKGGNSTQHLSEDGGFTWVSSVSVNDTNQVTTAKKLEANLSIGDFIEKEGLLNLQYTQKDKGFIDDAGVTDANTHIYQLNGELKATDYDTVKISGNYVRKKENGSSPTVNAQASYQWIPSAKSTYEVGVKASRSNRETTYELAAALQREISEKLTMRASATVGLDDEIQHGDSNLDLGVDYKFGKNLALTMDAMIRSHGSEMFAVGGKYTNDQNAEYSLSYQFGDTGNDAGLLKDSKMVFGGKQQLKDNLSLSAAATTHLQDGTIAGSTTSAGVKYAPNSNLDLDFLAEYGKVSDIQKFAVSTGFNKKAPAYTFNGKFEYGRNKDVSNDQRTETYGAALNHSLDGKDWHGTATVEGLLTRENSALITELGKYARASMGAAYRPENKDDLAALMMYTFLYDLPPESQLNADQLSQIAHLFSVEASYRLNDRFRVGAKVGLKLGKQTTTRVDDDWSKTLVQLGIVKVDAKLIERLSATLEGRLLSVSDQHSLQTAVVGSLYYRFGNSTKLGVGYNYGGVTDDLEQHTKNDEGWFLNLVSSF